MTSPLDSYQASLSRFAFDEEAKARMISALEKAASSADEPANASGPARADSPARAAASPKRAAARRPRRWLGLAAACLACALIVGGGGVAVAAGVLPNPANVLSDVFGETPAQTELLGSVGRPVDASCTANGVTVTADAVIGDRSNCTVVYSLAFDDPAALEGVEPAADGTLPLVADTSRHIDGTRTGGGGAYFYDADPEDGTIQYVETMGFTTWNGEGIIGRTMRFSLSKLSVATGTGALQPLASGTWNLKFAMNYPDTTLDLPAGQMTAWHGSPVTIDAVAVSAIGVTVSYSIDRQMGSLGPSGEMSAEAQAEANAVTGLPVIVSFADGTTFDATDIGSAATKQVGSASSVTKAATYDRIVSTSDIASVTVGDVVIPASAA